MSHCQIKRAFYAAFGGTSNADVGTWIGRLFPVAEARPTDIAIKTRS